MTEHQIQTLIVNFLKQLNVLNFETDVMSGLMFNKNRMAFIKHHQKMGYIKGQPDLIVCLKNKVIFLEVKSDKGKQTPEQKRFEELCGILNLSYYVVRNIQDVIKVLKIEAG